MNVAFFCSTPYQILLALNIKRNLVDCNADIYIFDHFMSSNDVLNNLISSHIFDNCYFINIICTFSKFSIIRYFEKTLKFFTYKIQLKKIGYDMNKSYDRVYLTYPHIIIQYFLIHCFILNKNITVHIFEDGTGGYIDVFFRTTLFKKFIRLLIPRFRILDTYHEILLHKTEMFSGNQKIRVTNLPIFDKNDYNFIKQLNTIFNYNSIDDRINERFIFFEQAFMNDKQTSVLIAQVASIIYDVIGKYDFIVKIHPRSFTNIYNDYNNYHKNSVPWELILLNEDVENKVLITYFSTAVFTPKLIFDIEPYIILLFELEELANCSSFSEYYRIFANMLKEISRDSDHIYIPQNIEDLKIRLVRFLTKTNNQSSNN